MDSIQTSNTTGLNWQKALDASKSIIPWLVLAFNLVYGYAVKMSTSDRTQQQQLEDHITVMEMRDRLGKLEGNYDTFLSLYQQQQRNNNNGTR